MKTQEMMQATHKRHALAERNAKQVAPTFLWRQSGGRGMIAPEDMDTGHLFNTLKMIWNNAAPSEMHLPPVKLYAFDRKFYTLEYMSRAVSVMSEELNSRPLNNYQLDCMKFIEQQLARIGHAA